MNDVVGIYRIENTLNNKSYIGQSICIENRLCQHLKSFEKKQDALNREDEELSPTALRITVLEICNKEDLDAREQYWIEYYNSFENGYNRTTGGRFIPCDFTDEVNSYREARRQEVVSLRIQNKKDTLIAFAKKTMVPGMLLPKQLKEQLAKEFSEKGLRDKGRNSYFTFAVVKNWLRENKICDFRETKVSNKAIRNNPELNLRLGQCIDKVIPYEERDDSE